MENNINTKSLFVSIVGKPNAGKSSVMNMLVNSKISIVSPKPQTTRNRVMGIFTKNDTQIVFTDTPGVHKPISRLGDYMVSEINRSFSGCEACLHVVEAGKSPSDIDLGLIKKFKNIKQDVILAINKTDLLKNKTLIIKQIEEFNNLFKYEATVPVCAKNGSGKEELLGELIKLSRPSVFFFSEDDITNQTERAMVSEVIREKLLCFLDKELPHGTAAYVESFKFRENGDLDISAVIYCEKENHKRMIIGHGGEMIKKIGIFSRTDLEKMLSYKINLKLFVKVKENWRNKESALKDLGYFES